MPHLFYPKEFRKRVINFEKFGPQFAWLPVETIQKMFEVTTQYAHIPTSSVLWKYFKSLFPERNVSRQHEPVTTDMVYSDTLAVDNGAKAAQIFVRTESLLMDVYGMKSDKQFVNTLEDTIHDRGMPTRLLSD